MVWEWACWESAVLALSQQKCASCFALAVPQCIGPCGLSSWNRGVCLQLYCQTFAVVKGLFVTQLEEDWSGDLE